MTNLKKNQNEKTQEVLVDILKDAKTVVWNGPMGVFEMSNFAKGTIGVCESIASLTDATTIIGGGDSAAAAEQLGFADQFTHIIFNRFIRESQRPIFFCGFCVCFRFAVGLRRALLAAFC